jgi:hypothetical protein
MRSHLSITLSEWCEVPTGVVAQIMGHKPSAIAEKHYRRRPLDLLRSWHVKIEAWILEQAGICSSKRSLDSGPSNSPYNVSTLTYIHTRGQHEFTSSEVG